MREPYTRQQVIDAIERKGGGTVPVLLHKWWGDGLEARYGDALGVLEAAYPDDVCDVWYMEPGFERSPNGNPAYRLGFKDYDGAARHSIGEAVVLLEDWDELDRFLDSFPSIREPGIFDAAKAKVAQHGKDRYTLGCWWRLFHERLWSIRGMENLMLDYYDNMDGLRMIGERLLAYYKELVDAYRAIGCDGIFSSDDLGHQQGPMMSPAVFHELYFPLYKELIDYVHARGMHMVLHSCGDNTLLMEDLIAAGLDVFHPVQKGCMDMAETAAKYGGRISFLAGVDVQHLLPEGTPEQVRAEIREMKRTFYRPEGGLLLAMGNGILADTPLENIRAALDEMCDGLVM